MSTYTVPATGKYGNSESGRFHYKAGDVIPLETAAKLGMAGAQDTLNAAATLADEVERRNAVWQSIHATADGLGVGLIPATVRFVEVMSTNANHIATLPDPRGTTVVELKNSGAYELRSHDPENVAINNGAGVAAESAIPANTHLVCFSYSGEWSCATYAGVSIDAAAP